MTTPIEQRLRLTLQEMAEEVHPSRPPENLSGTAALGVRRTVAFGLAAVVFLVAVVSAVTLWRGRGHGVVQPVVRPPQVVRLSDETVRAPGRTLLAVFAGAVRGTEKSPRTANLLPAAGGPARRLALSGTVTSAFVQQLSLDGTRLVRQNDSV
jgi:hypothetical protein